MARNIPGIQWFKGITLAEFHTSFPTDKAALPWCVRQRRGDTPRCHHCGSENVNMEAKHPDMPDRCRAKGCRKHFPVKTGTCMECSNLSRRDRLFSFFQAMTNVRACRP